MRLLTKFLVKPNPLTRETSYAWDYALFFSITQPCVIIYHFQVFIRFKHTVYVF